MCELWLLYLGPSLLLPGNEIHCTTLGHHLRITNKCQSRYNAYKLKKKISTKSSGNISWQVLNSQIKKTAKLRTGFLRNLLKGQSRNIFASYFFLIQPMVLDEKKITFSYGIRWVDIRKTASTDSIESGRLACGHNYGDIMWIFILDNMIFK